MFLQLLNRKWILYMIVCAFVRCGFSSREADNDGEVELELDCASPPLLPLFLFEAWLMDFYDMRREELESLIRMLMIVGMLVDE